MGWQASMVKDTSFAEACLRMALWRRDHTRRPIEPAMIHHSDAGSQGTSIRFTEIVFDWVSRYNNSGSTTSSGTSHPRNTSITIALRQAAYQLTKP